MAKDLGCPFKVKDMANDLSQARSKDLTVSAKAESKDLNFKGKNRTNDLSRTRLSVRTYLPRPNTE